MDAFNTWRANSLFEASARRPIPKDEFLNAQLEYQLPESIGPHSRYWLMVDWCSICISLLFGIRKSILSWQFAN